MKNVPAEKVGMFFLYFVLEKEISDMTTPKSDEKNKETFKGTLIFWLCEIMGELGIHCFVNGRTLRERPISAVKGVHEQAY